MKTKLPSEITTIEQARQFLIEMYKNNEAYHPEDDAHEIIWNLPPEKQPTFKEKKQLNKLMNDIYNLPGVPDKFDPCGITVDHIHRDNFVKLVQTLVNAAQQLENYWDKENPIADYLLTPNYPFESSFDELTTRIVSWGKSVKSMEMPPPEEPTQANNPAEGNKLIAEAMGIKLKGGGKSVFDDPLLKKYFRRTEYERDGLCPECHGGPSHGHDHRCYVLDESKLEYHSNWNELIPAVAYVTSGCSNGKEHNPYYEKIRNAQGAADIQALWASLVEFIKWRNSPNDNLQLIPETEPVILSFDQFKATMIRLPKTAAWAALEGATFFPDNCYVARIYADQYWIAELSDGTFETTCSNKEFSAIDPEEVELFLFQYYINHCTEETL